MAQLVKRLTLGFGTGHALMVCLCVDSAEPAWDPLPPLSLSAPTLLMLSLFLSQNKYYWWNLGHMPVIWLQRKQKKKVLWVLPEKVSLLWLGVPLKIANMCNNF